MLLQVVFHARVAEEAEADAFDIDTVAGLLVEKLVRRHPHVFADGDATTPAEVEQAWERIKAEEKAAGADGGRGYAADLLHGIPASCPATSRPRRCSPGCGAAASTPEPDAVARLERARAALAAAEAEVRAALRLEPDAAQTRRGAPPGRASAELMPRSGSSRAQTSCLQMQGRLRSAM